MRLGPPLLIFLLVGCPSAADDDDITPPPIGNDDDTPTEACEPALSIIPAEANVLPLDLILLDGEGGTGDYSWELVTDASGALLNERTGAYLAGGDTGTVDTVRLTDLGCEGEATSTVTVIPPMIVEPNVLAVPPGTTFTYRVMQGSGSFTCSLSSDGSGALVDEDCSYTSGAALGRDLVRVEDDETGEFVLREIVVDPTAALTHDPQHLALPRDGTCRLRPQGGSGFFVVSSDDPTVATGDTSELVGLEAGRTTLVVADEFTGLSAEITVTVVAPVPVDRRPWADVLMPGQARSADINGDGHTDLVVSAPGVAVEAFQGGGVFVYEGTADGLDPTPVQAFGGQQFDEWGYGLDLGDIDGDGEIDLVIGAEEDDEAADNAGAVHIFSGVTNGFFESAPTTTVLGPRGNTRFGRAVAVCDYDGDGFLDMAVGAFDDENQAADPTRNNQGAVYLHRGSATGFGPLPDQILWGRDYQDGEWVDDGNQFFGLYLAAGDMDGDGRCELAAASYTYDGPRFNNQGLVTVHIGNSIGVSADPWRAFTQLDPAEPHNAELGRQVAMGDLDGDGLADLAMGGPSASVPELGTAREGRVYVFLGASMGDFELGLSEVNEADFIAGGDSSSALFGRGLAIGDIDGDAVDDLLVGAPEDEREGGPSNSGSVFAYLGVSGGLPSPTPSHEWAGEVEGDWFGGWLAALDDYDGDGISELGIFAARSNGVGTEVGLPYVATSADLAVTALDWPVEPANHDFAVGMAFVPDIDGDGNEDLFFGSDESPDAGEGRRQGRALLYTDPSTVATHLIDDFAPLSPGDRFGRDVSGIGDFNGDGIDDFAVLSHDEHRPGTFDETVFSNPEAGCAGERSDTGAVYVFLGEVGGLSSQPAFVVYGPQNNQSLHRLAWGDVDGDGYSDVVFTGNAWDRDGRGDAGGFGVLHGRPWVGPGIDVVCDPYIHLGRNGGDNLGHDAAPMGDLNGDGCDEFVVSAHREEGPAGNEGVVHVVFGWGAGCDYGSPYALSLRGGQGNANLGTGVDGGADVDGDGLPDLAVGADNHTFVGSQVGRAYFIPGSWMTDQTPDLLEVGTTPPNFVDITSLDDRWFVQGRIDEEDLGQDVALVAGINGNLGGVLAGSPGGGQSGFANTGGGRVYAIAEYGDGHGFDPKPFLVISGESWRVGTRLGTTVAAGTRDGAPWVVLGSHIADGDTVDSGAAYALPVLPPGD